MPENKLFLPEGLRNVPELSLPLLKEVMESGAVLEAIPQRCDIDQTLHFRLNGIHAQMIREKSIAPWISGANRAISTISRVGKPTCFTVESVDSDAKGAPIVWLNRRIVQEQAMDWFLAHLQPGMVLTCCVTHLETFGAFLDIGCGIVAMLPVEHISVSRISHPKDRFCVGQKILAAVLSIDREKRRITMTHRELLGTWMENASYFRPGETVRGVVRSIQSYGSFVELTPNLSGLTEIHENLKTGDSVSVFIKSMDPSRMKIKLQFIAKLPDVPEAEPLRYYVTDGTLTHWVYSPPGCSKAVETVFTEAYP